MIASIFNFLIVNAQIVVPVVLVALMIVSESVRAGVALFVRMVGRALLIAAVIALVYDGTRTLGAGSGLVLTSLAEHWQSLAPQSLAGFKAVVVRLNPSAWDLGALRVLKLPAWLVLGVIGLLFAWVGRKRKGVNVYVN